MLNCSRFQITTLLDCESSPGTCFARRMRWSEQKLPQDIVRAQSIKAVRRFSSNVTEVFDNSVIKGRHIGLHPQHCQYFVISFASNRCEVNTSGGSAVSVACDFPFMLVGMDDTLQSGISGRLLAVGDFEVPVKLSEFPVLGELDSPWRFP